jgi:hypothetical protein
MIVRGDIGLTKKLHLLNAKSRENPLGRWGFVIANWEGLELLRDYVIAGISLF